jgi:hypothetical protein
MGRSFDCVDGNMNVLMYNNTVRKIRDLKIGDNVYSVQYNGNGYQYIKSTVTGINKRKGKAVKITLSDGRSLISSPNHQWLTQQGWLFTVDDSTLCSGKLFLAPGIKMSGFTGKLSGTYKQTRHYMQGYFVGTEIYGRNLTTLKGGELAEFVLQEAKVTMRMYNYLLYFQADAAIEDCFAHDNNTNEYYITKKLSLPYEQVIALSEKFSKNQAKEEFIRGFVAGVYDSDGSASPFVKNVNSTKRQFLDIVKSGLELYGFEFTYNSQERSATLLGGPSELLRFYYIFDPVTACKVENLEIEDKHHDRIKVVSIEEVHCDDMVEVTTTGRNFIANGIVSHNCYTGFVKEV